MPSGCSEESNDRLIIFSTEIEEQQERFRDAARQGGRRRDDAQEASRW